MATVFVEPPGLCAHPDKLPAKGGSILFTISASVLPQSGKIVIQHSIAGSNSYYFNVGGMLTKRALDLKPRRISTRPREYATRLNIVPAESCEKTEAFLVTAAIRTTDGKASIARRTWIEVV